MIAGDPVLAAQTTVEAAGFTVEAAGFWSSNGDVVAAIATIVVALVVAQIVDRLWAKQVKAIHQRVGGGELSPVADTRLRLLRRLTFAAIVLIGVTLALSQVTSLQSIATALLASGAVVAAVVGFAARQTLANGIAGIQLAITQPVRIGDVVTVADCTGTVEDIGLTYTYLKDENQRRLIVPNEQLAGSQILNHTIIDPVQRFEVSAWLPPGADAGRAAEALAEESRAVCAEHGAAHGEVAVAELTPDGTRLAIRAVASDAHTQRALADALRAAAAARLRREWGQGP